MLTEQQLDQFIDEFWEDIPNERAEDGPAEDLDDGGTEHHPSFP